MITANQFGQHFMPKLEKEVNTIVNNLRKGDKLFYADGSTKSLYKDTRVNEASGTMRQLVDGANVEESKLNDGHAKRRHVRKYGTGIEYTEFVQMCADPKLLKRITTIGANAPNQLLYNLEAAAIELGDQGLANIPKVQNVPMIDTIAADGQPIFSTQHTWKSSGMYTWANKTAAFESLNGTNLFKWCNAIELWRDNLGQLTDIRAKELVVGHTNRKKAIELIRSTDDSETANRSTNATKELGLKLTVWNRMISPEECFLRTTAENDFLVEWLYKPKTERDYNKSNQVHKIILTMAFSMGVGYPGHWFANKKTA